MKSETFDNIPEIIRREGRFCCWRYERNKDGRLTKVPYNPVTRNRARSNDPSDYDTFETTKKAYTQSQQWKCPYNGIILHVADGFGAIDIDHCILEDGSLSELAVDILRFFPHNYFEVSPSGHGLRSFFRVGEDFEYSTSVYMQKKGDLEIYFPAASSRNASVTGNVYQNGPIITDENALHRVLDTYMLREKTTKDAEMSLEGVRSYLTDEEVISKGCAANNGKLFLDLYEGKWAEHKYPSQSEADLAFASLLAFWCGCDFEQMNRIFERSGLYRSKWERSLAGSTYGAETLENAIRHCKRVYTPIEQTSAEEDFEALPDESQTPADRIFALSAQEAAAEFRKLLSEELTPEMIYRDDTLFLAAKTFKTAPYLYDTLRNKAKQLGLRMGALDSMAAEKKNELTRRQVTKELTERNENTPIPNFLMFNHQKGGFEVNCPKLASHVRANLPYKLVQDGGMGALLKYVYQNGCYYPCSDDRMKGYIKKFITDYDDSILSMSTVEEVFRQLVTDLDSIPSSTLNQDEGIINFQNGILHLDTMELQSHSPDILSTIQIPCNWKGTALPTPVFDSFMQTFTSGQKGVEQLLLQFMGVCLSNVKGWRMKKALFLQGEGNTGKSQLKGLTERLLGAENHIGIDLDKIEARFGTSAIYGKRLAGSSDMKFMTIRELETFKQCTGGDALFAEFKGLPAFHFVYNGLLWFCTNKAPKFGGDQGDWVYERMMLVDCHNVIPREKQDKHIVDKMYAEREGIMYKVVMALKQVIDNGYHFDEPESVVESRRAYKLQNNSVMHFFDVCMQERPIPERVPKNDKYTVKRIHGIYCKWCKTECNGYSSNLAEFKRIYSEYCDRPLENCIGSRNGGHYLLFHELLPDVYEEYCEWDDAPTRDRYPNRKSAA